MHIYTNKLHACVWKVGLLIGLNVVLMGQEHMSCGADKNQRKLRGREVTECPQSCDPSTPHVSGPVDGRHARWPASPWEAPHSLCSSSLQDALMMHPGEHPAQEGPWWKGASQTQWLDLHVLLSYPASVGPAFHSTTTAWDRWVPRTLCIHLPAHGRTSDRAFDLVGKPFPWPQPQAARQGWDVTFPQGAEDPNVDGSPLF